MTPQACLPVQKLSASDQLCYKVHLARGDVHSVQADAVGMLHLHTTAALLENVCLPQGIAYHLSVQSFGFGFVVRHFGECMADEAKEV